MSAPACKQRKVCLRLGSVSKTECGRHVPPRDTDWAHVEVFINLPRQAQCDRCHRNATEPPIFIPSAHAVARLAVADHGHSSATPQHIASVSLFCAGLHGCFTPRMLDLLAQMLAGDDAARMVLLDLAEQTETWPTVEREWRKLDKHGTGNNPHVWLVARGVQHLWTDISSGIPVPRVTVAKQCPCGTYEPATLTVGSGHHLEPGMAVSLSDGRSGVVQSVSATSVTVAFEHT